MKFYTRKRKPPSIIIISLIDILAILLIFFIVTTTFEKNQAMQINLPESKSATTAPAEKQQPLVLRVKSATEITLDDKPVKIEALSADLKAAREKEPSRAFAMQADREAPFGLIVKVMDSLKEAGLQNIPTYTQPEKQ
jgi:biopolymer transport protein ExbD